MPQGCPSSRADFHDCKSFVRDRKKLIAMSAAITAGVLAAKTVFARSDINENQISVHNTSSRLAPGKTSHSGFQHLLLTISASYKNLSDSNSGGEASIINNAILLPFRFCCFVGALSSSSHPRTEKPQKHEAGAWNTPELRQDISIMHETLDELRA